MINAARPVKDSNFYHLKKIKNTTKRDKKINTLPLSCSIPPDLQSQKGPPGQSFSARCLNDLNSYSQERIPEPSSTYVPRVTLKWILIPHKLTSSRLVRDRPTSKEIVLLKEKQCTANSNLYHSK